MVWRRGGVEVDPARMSRSAFLEWAREASEQTSLLIDEDRCDEAHRRFMEIAGFFAPDDPSWIAAYLWQQLGVTWRTRREGLARENLLWSKEMLERARTHPARRADPYKLALTRGSLAVTLRQLMAFSSGAERRALARRAEKLFDAAIGRLDRMVLGAPKANRHGLLADRCEVRNNRANLLGDLGRFDEAITDLRRALRDIESVRSPPQQAIALLSQIRLNLARALTTRAHPRDAEQARRLFESVRVSENPRLAGQASMQLARLAKDAGDDAEAQRLLAGLGPNQLPPEAEPGIVLELSRLGAHGQALTLANAFIGAACARRVTTLSAGNADQEAQRLQQLASARARVHIALDEPIEAFLVLENYAGNRFDETLRRHYLPHRDRVSVELLALSVLADDCAIAFEEAIGGLSFAAGFDRAHAVEQSCEALVEYFEQRQEVPSTSPQGDIMRARALEQARALGAAGDPAAALHRHARAFADEANRLREVAYAHDPTLARADRGNSITPPALRRLAETRSNEVFIRLNILDDLLGVAVWFEGGRLVTRHLTLPLPEQHHAVLQALHADVHSAADGRAASLFEAIDLSPLFPPRRGQTAVFLPSRLASMLPLAGVGPPGRTPLDHFDAIRQMPNLRPLRVTLPAGAGREGKVALVGPGTLLGASVFDPPLPDERRFTGKEATVDQFREGLAHARVVSVYTHGRHEWGRPGCIALADADAVPSFEHRLPNTWRGIERIELWACRSGSTIQDDHRGSPFVDELTGLDGMFLQTGARSVLGATLPVREVVTHEISAVYRDGIAAGLAADRALADAQRWWRDRLPSMTAGELAHLDGREDGERREGQAAALRCPSSWAVFRVMGVCDPPPIDAAPDVRDTPLEAEDIAQLDALIAAGPRVEGGPEQPGTTEAAEQFERDLAGATSAVARRAATPDEALAIAELYRGRLHGDPLHNVMRALAWLHDALADPALTDEAGARLGARAAYLWLDVVDELALGWGSARFAFVLTRVWTRIDALLAALPPTEARGVRAVRAAQRLHSSPLEAPGEANEALALLGDVNTLSVEDLVRGAELAQWGSVVAPTLVTRVLDEAASRSDGATRSSIADACRSHRLAAALDPLARRYGRPAPGAIAAWLTPRERTVATNGTRRDIEAAHGAAAREALDTLRDELLDDLEALVWGQRSPIDETRWRGTGGQSVSWWATTLSVMQVVTHQVQDPRTAAPSLLTALHLGADLRTQQLNQWSRLSYELSRDGTPEQLDVIIPARMREATLDLLVDAALDPVTTTDPFAQSVDTLRAAHDAGAGRVGWAAADVAGLWRDDECGPARTVAGRLARAASVLDADCEEAWPKLIEQERRATESPGVEERPLTRASTPRLDIRALQRELVTSAARMAWLTLGHDPTRGCFAALTHRDVCRIEVGEASPESGDLLALFTPREGVVPAMPRFAMVDAWARLSSTIEPLVVPALRAALAAGARDIYVLAPGALRMVPLLGLMLDGELLASHLAARGGRLAHLPALGWAAPRAPKALDGCLGPGDDPLMRAVLDGLRAVGPTRALDPHGGHWPGASELDALASDGTPLARLRLTGQGDALSGVGYASAIFVGDCAPITPRDVDRLTFAPGAEVELWACVDHRSPQEWGVAARDRLPGPVRSALRGGASGVLDLAWPIDPLVRALLCEAFGLATRHDRLSGSQAICRAVADVHRALTEAPEETFAEAIARGRQQAWRERGLDLSAMRPLPDDLAHVDRAALRRRLTTDLAAPRWWGA